MSNKPWLLVIFVWFYSLNVLATDIINSPLIEESHPQDNILYSQEARQAAGNGGDDFLAGLLSNGKAISLTPDKHEQIDLFSGSVRLSYTDVSIPVAPGLNMEYTRTYNSSIYDKFPFHDVRHWQANMAQNGWQYHSGYISVLDFCFDNTNLCRPVYVDAKGNAEVLLLHDNVTRESKSKSHKKFQLVGDTFVMWDSNGFKYYFTHRIKVKQSARIYLTKVETPDGNHFVEYHYYNDLIQKITSSDTNKVIDVKFEPHAVKYKNVHHTVYQPSEVLFNGTSRVKYFYNFTFLKKHNGYTIVPVSVKFASGLQWDYTYGFLDLRIKHSVHGPYSERVFLTSVTHPDKAKSVYYYTADFNTRFAGVIYGAKLIKREAYTDSNRIDGAWEFQHLDDKNIDGNLTKHIRVKGPSYLSDYYFNSYNNANLWRLGLPALIQIYSDFSTNKILQQEEYYWDKVQDVDNPYTVKIHKNYIYTDPKTYRAVLKNKVITRDGSEIKNSYTDYDEFDNPKKIVQQGTKGTRTINIDYLNILDKNILGLKTRVVIDGNNIITNSFDDYGHVTESTQFGVQNKYNYKNGLLVSHTDGNGYVTQYGNYASGIPQRISYHDGTSVQSIINSDGTIASNTNQNGVREKFEYNNLGQLVKQIPAQGASVIYNYNGLTTEISHGNRLDTESYDANNNLVNKTEGGVYSTKMAYDALGRNVFKSYRTSINSSVNRGHYYDYDSLGRVVSDCYPDKGSSCVMFEYSNNNRKILYPNGEIIKQKYNGFGDHDNIELSQVDQAGRITDIERDLLGNVTSVKQGGIAKQYYYDKNFRLAKYIEPETGVTEYKYDKSGNVTEKKVNGKSINYKYQKIADDYKIEAVNYSDKSENEYYRYDKLGNVVAAVKGKIEKQYQYDHNNKLINEVQKAGDKSARTQYLYNDLNQLLGVIYPDGLKINYEPNVFGQPTRVGDYLTNIQYHPSGYWSSYQYGNRVVANSMLDHQNRVAHFNYGTINLNYDYDANNNLLNLTASDSQQSNYNYNVNFHYDGIGRIVNARAGQFDIKYQYDSNDNLTRIDNGISKLDLNYSKNKITNLNNYNGTKKVRSHKYSYDVNGNVVDDTYSQYTYGLDGNLLKASNKFTIDYQYDVNNNRVLQTSKKHNVYTIYNYNSLALTDYDKAKDAYTNYIYFNGKKIAQVSHNKNGTQETSYFYNDSLGSPIAMSDSQGKTLWHEFYLPFGARVIQDSKADNNKQWFVGKEVEPNASDVSYFGARYYSQNLGRFMSPDPVAVNPELPHSFNRYAYGANNPYKYVDEDGREINLLPVMATEFVFGAIIGASTTYDGETISSAVIGGLAGGTAAVLTNLAESGAAAQAATRGFGTARTLVSSMSINMATNTAMMSLTNYILDKEIGVVNSLTSSFYGFWGSKKVNPMGITSRTPSQTLLMNNKSTALSFISSKLHDSLFSNTSGNSYSGYRASGNLVDLSSPAMVRYNASTHYGKSASACLSIGF